MTKTFTLMRAQQRGRRHLLRGAVAAVALARAHQGECLLHGRTSFLA